MKRLYVIGVGPGAPDLITLRGVERLRRSQIIFCPVRDLDSESIAFQTVKPHLPEDVKIVRVHFPMVRDRSLREEAWKRAASLLMKEDFEEASFVTIGDPSIYCTFYYVKRFLTGIEVEVVPGVASFSACSASMVEPLVLGDETLLITSGMEKIPESYLGVVDTLVVMKPPRDPLKRLSLAKELEERDYSVVFARRCQMPDEEIFTYPPKNYDYISLLIAKK